jgi:purine-binding chemotaxis protein CheW
VFTKVPYERIAQYGVAECSSCGLRFTLDREEIRAALIEAMDSQDAEDSLDIEENEELDAEGSLDIEENEELDAECSLDIEETEELDAEDSLDIEENEELDAEDSLDIDENEELDAEGSLDIEENLTAPTEDASSKPIMEPADADESSDNDSSAPQQPAPPADISPTGEVSRPGAGFEPEKEDKIEFARRLSRLVPEGWVNPSQDYGTVTSSETPLADSTSPDLEQLKDHRQFLVFSLGTAEFAVPVENTTEIGMVPELTRLPHVPGWLLGIINLRGDIVSVFDMKNFLGMGPFDFGRHDRIILLRSCRKDICTAMIVNRIVGMHYVAEKDLIMNEAGQQGTEQHILGVFEMNEQSIAVLDIDNLMQSDDMQQFRAL